jgi:S-formylglutathione hydrolase FrmB
MKLLLYGLLLFISHSVVGQSISRGKTLRIQFQAASIAGNLGGESAMRHLTIYLPPCYNKETKRYPVIYFLHGMTWNDSSTMADIRFDLLLDKAISSGRIPPVILVLPDGDTQYKGSWYTNSKLTGKWTDFIAQDVVSYVDLHFHTLPNRNSRGLSGISMGGHGALKVAMLYPDVFGAVYAMTPAVLNWSEGTNVKIPAFQHVASALTKEDLGKFDRAMLLVNLGRSFSPNTNKAPFYADMPVKYINGRPFVDSSVIQRWNENLPTQMVAKYIASLKSLTALKIDWGRNDLGKHVPVTCLEFSQTLERLGIKHFAEEYLGGHSDKLAGEEGRVYTEVLPFFNTYLK